MKRNVGAIGGAVAGYLLFRRMPIIGGIIGFFVGRKVGENLDQRALPAAAEGARPPEIEVLEEN